MAKRSKSSNRWLERQRKDVFARRARRDGAVSRAHYKFEELDLRFRLVRPNSTVLELGAAPGGWTHYVAEKVAGGATKPSRSGVSQKAGKVVACDFRPFSAPSWVIAVEGEAGTPEIDAQIAAHLSTGCDLVISDMAPNITGVRAADQAAAMGLADMALEFAHKHLKPGGHLVVKMFQGEGVDRWIIERRSEFEKCQLVKPKASRSESRELFAVGLHFHGTTECYSDESAPD